MAENGSGEEGLLVRAEPMGLAKELSRRMVDVRVVDDALLLDADPTWAGAINTVLATKGVRGERAAPRKVRAATRPREVGDRALPRPMDGGGVRS